MERGKNEEEPLPDWLAPEGDNAAQAANLLNDTAGAGAPDSNPRLHQTLNVFKMGKK